MLSLLQFTYISYFCKYAYFIFYIIINFFVQTCTFLMSYFIHLYQLSNKIVYVLSSLRILLDGQLIDYKCLQGKCIHIVFSLFLPKYNKKEGINLLFHYFISILKPFAFAYKSSSTAMLFILFLNTFNNKSLPPPARTTASVLIG